MEVLNDFTTMTNFLNNETYINLLDCSKKSDMEEISISKLSWIECIEQELNLDSENKTFENFQVKNEDNIKNIDVNAFNSIKFNDLTDIKILEYQTVICNHLKKNFKNKNLNDNNINDIILKIDWLLDTSKYLSNKLGLTTFQHKNFDNLSIHRSSYKFCNYNFECQYNYNLKKYCGCYAQHYVHNLIYADLEVLKKYILQNKNNFNNIFLEEFKKSINTISYAIGHMYEELERAQKYNFFKIDNKHIERTPKKKKFNNKIHNH